MSDGTGGRRDAATPAAGRAAGASDVLLEQLGGKHRAQALSTAAALGIADELADGAVPATELATRLECDAATLTSLLRLLAGLGYLEEPKPGRFAVTELGRTLQRDALGPFAEFVGCAEQWNPWAELRNAIRDRSPTAPTAFERSNGRPLYQFVARDHEAAARYDAAVDAFTRHEATNLRDCLDLATAHRIVDVGAGRGTLLFELLDQWPQALGVLFDLPHVTAAARISAPAHLHDRIEYASGDFFHEVPTAGDCYLLKHVLHNWDDDRAIALLRRCADAMAGDGQIVVIDAILAPDSRPDLARMLDLEMRVLTGGRERRKPELRRLLQAAGLTLTTIEQLTAASWVLTAKKKD
ncbi:MAG: acetylserotonin O-methyltransferase [bacterium]|nr:acetylserotonin O-methyltransferase [bacterium]